MKLSVIQNAFENVKKFSQDKLVEKYPNGVPEAIQKRYLQELTFLENSDCIDDFEIFRCLSEEAKKSNTLMNMRGTVSGSILCYLLGNHSFNPLSTHYYCMECGYYEKVDTHLFGIDLPSRKCPCCNTEMWADGYNLSLESVWGIDGKKSISFEYNVNSEFLAFARRTLEKIYPDQEVVRWGMFQFNSTQFDERMIGVDLVGYAILPSENTIQDYTDLISYLENGDICITGGILELQEHSIKPVRLLTVEILDELTELQRQTGIYANEIGNKELREITWSNICNTAAPSRDLQMLFQKVKPKTYRDMVALESGIHSTFSWQNGQQGCFDIDKFIEMTLTNDFKLYPCFTREDFYDYMIESGVDRVKAYEAFECIRKGYAVSAKHNDEWKHLKISEGIKNVAKNYRYVFPRAHCIGYVLGYAKLAYYAKVDGKMFGRVVFGKK